MTKPLKQGDTREDGWIFQGYQKSGKEHWMSPTAFHMYKLYGALKNASIRAEAQQVPFDITRDYLLSIFPEDNRCPVTGVVLKWGRVDGQENSPSLDKIIPELGYVEGNLIWVSNFVNRIKSNASVSMLKKIVDFYSHIGG